MHVQDALSSLPPSPANLAKLMGLRELLVKKQRAEAKATTSRFAKYVNDPIAFVSEGLNEHLWSKQREVIASIAKNRRTAVPSCHEAGKSFIAARAAAWWCSRGEPGDYFVVTSAPSFAQVRAILWREMNRAHRKGGLPGRMNQTEWWISDEMVAFGRKPADMDTTAFQGIHAKGVLVIFDEATGIPRALWDAGDSLIANEASAFMAIGNPDDPTSYFAEVCKPGSGWNVIPISAFDTPNFTKETIPAELNGLLISPLWVEEKKRSWGEGSPLYVSKVLGQFPEQADDGLVPIQYLIAAKTRELPKGTPVELGVDVARFGSDHTVIYARFGAVFRKVAREHKRDLMHLVGTIMRLVREMKTAGTPVTSIKIDDAGLGGGVTDRLHELQTSDNPSDTEPRALLKNVEVLGINVGEGPSTNEADEKFANLRAELNWSLRDRFVEGDIDIEDDDLLLNQAAQIKYKPNSRGEIQIEKKEDMKKRTQGVSPDDWDALVLANAKPSFPGSGFLEMAAADRAAAEQRKKGT